MDAFTLGPTRLARGIEMKLWLVIAFLLAIVLGGVGYVVLSKSKPGPEPEPIADESGAWQRAGRIDA